MLLELSFFKRGHWGISRSFIDGVVAAGFNTSAMLEWDCTFPPPPFPRALLSVWVERTSSGGIFEMVGGRTRRFGTGGRDSVGDIGLLVGELD